MTSAHSINELVVDISFSSKALARREQNQLSDWLSQELLPALDMLFEHYLPGRQVMRFERLEFDFGNLSASNYKTQIHEKLLQKIRALIQERSLALPSPAPSRELISGDSSPSRQNAVAQLVIFLRTGQMPWYRNPSLDKHAKNSHEQLLLTVLEDPDLPAALIAIPEKPLVVQRLLAQFPVAQLQRLVVRLAQQQSELIADINQFLNSAWQNGFLQESDGRGLYQILLQHFLQPDHPALDKMLAEIFRQIETRLNLAVPELRAVFNATAKQLSHPALVIFQRRLLGYSSSSSQELDAVAKNSVAVSEQQILHENFSTPPAAQPSERQLRYALGQAFVQGNFAQIQILWPLLIDEQRSLLRAAIAEYFPQLLIRQHILARFPIFVLADMFGLVQTLPAQEIAAYWSRVSVYITEKNIFRSVEAATLERELWEISFIYAAAGKRDSLPEFTREVLEELWQRHFGEQNALIELWIFLGISGAENKSAISSAETVSQPESLLDSEYRQWLQVNGLTEEEPGGNLENIWRRLFAESQSDNHSLSIASVLKDILAKQPNAAKAIFEIVRKNNARLERAQLTDADWQELLFSYLQLHQHQAETRVATMDAGFDAASDTASGIIKALKSYSRPPLFRDLLIAFLDENTTHLAQLLQPSQALVSSSSKPAGPMHNAVTTQEADPGVTGAKLSVGNSQEEQERQLIAMLKQGHIQLGDIYLDETLAMQLINKILILDSTVAEEFRADLFNTILAKSQLVTDKLGYYRAVLQCLIAEAPLDFDTLLAEAERRRVRPASIEQQAQVYDADYSQEVTPTPLSREVRHLTQDVRLESLANLSWPQIKTLLDRIKADQAMLVNLELDALEFLLASLLKNTVGLETGAQENFMADLYTNKPGAEERQHFIRQFVIALLKGDSFEGLSRQLMAQRQLQKPRTTRDENPPNLESIFDALRSQPLTTENLDCTEADLLELINLAIADWHSLAHGQKDYWQFYIRKIARQQQNRTQFLRDVLVVLLRQDEEKLAQFSAQTIITEQVATSEPSMQTKTDEGWLGIAEAITADSAELEILLPAVNDLSQMIFKYLQSSPHISPEFREHLSASIKKKIAEKPRVYAWYRQLLLDLIFQQPIDFDQLDVIASTDTNTQSSAGSSQALLQERWPGRQSIPGKSAGHSVAKILESQASLIHSSQLGADELGWLAILAIEDLFDKESEIYQKRLIQQLASKSTESARSYLQSLLKILLPDEQFNVEMLNEVSAAPDEIVKAREAAALALFAGEVESSASSLQEEDGNLEHWRDLVDQLLDTQFPNSEKRQEWQLGIETWLAKSQHKVLFMQKLVKLLLNEKNASVEKLGSLWQVVSSDAAVQASKIENESLLPKTALINVELEVTAVKLLRGQKSVENLSLSQPQWIGLLDYLLIHKITDPQNRVQVSASVLRHLPQAPQSINYLRDVINALLSNEPLDLEILSEVGRPSSGAQSLALHPSETGVQQIVEQPLQGAEQTAHLSDKELSALITGILSDAIANKDAEMIIRDMLPSGATFPPLQHGLPSMISQRVMTANRVELEHIGTLASHSPQVALKYILQSKSNILVDVNAVAVVYKDALYENQKAKPESLAEMSLGKLALQKLVRLALQNKIVDSEARAAMNAAIDKYMPAEHEQIYLQQVLVAISNDELVDLESFAQFDDEPSAESAIPMTEKPVSEKPVNEKPVSENIQPHSSLVASLQAEFLTLLGKASLDTQESVQLQQLAQKILQRGDAELVKTWLNASISTTQINNLVNNFPPQALHKLLQQAYPQAYKRLESLTKIILDALALQAANIHTPAVQKVKWKFVLQYLFDEDAMKKMALLVEQLATAAGTNAAQLKQLVETRMDLQSGAGDNARPPMNSQTQTNETIEKQHKELLAEALQEGIHISNAGQILAGPYLPRLFSMLNLTEQGKFVSMTAADRAAHLVQYMVTGESRAPEYDLLLNKVICGINTSIPLSAGIEVSEQEKTIIEQMLTSMIQHWKILGSTSIAGLRQTFLQRQGWLSLEDDGWKLRVQPAPFDMLLDQLPWNISIIKHGWMHQPLRVSWRQ